MFCFTVGVTLRIHSARFCLWAPPELKLISSDSGDTGLMLGRGSVKMASLKLIMHLIAVAHTLTVL